jgi:hypothetical protein
MRWVVGVFVSVIIGHFVTYYYLRLLRKLSGLGVRPEADSVPKRIPSWLTGVTERLIFTAFIGSGGTAVVPAMGGWLALKLASNWNHPHWRDNAEIRTWAMSALLAGLVSMACAYVGGLIILGQVYVGI